MSYFCAQSDRRELVIQSPALNGIDYLEVLGDPGCGNQLAVTFLKDAQTLALAPNNVTLAGGRTVNVMSVTPASAEEPLQVTFDLDQTGDFSTYTFALVAGQGRSDPPPGLDPQLASVEFSFMAGCPTPADCLPDTCCPATLQSPPDINYLAKDYEAFLQAMLDRLAVTVPGWTERHAADLGIAVAEVLAYAADHLSYQQDAVSTEAYIGTARSRISLRRHARLVDYRIGEGCNARAFVQVTAGADAVPVPAGTLFYVGVPGLPSAARDGDPVAQQLAGSTQPVFAAMQDTVLYVAHNEIDFYTWSGSDCCLVPGATAATLVGDLPMLQTGDVLIFEEKLGPLSGVPGDADPTHRCAVQVATIERLQDPLTGDDVTTITWPQADAPSFPLCISSTTDAEHGGEPIDGVTVARGNVVPADHGVWIDGWEALGVVPPAPPVPVASAGCNCGEDGGLTAPPPRFYPQLAQSPLTFAASFTGVDAATSFMAPGSAVALPALEIQSDDGQAWTSLPDLLSSGASDRVLVPEIENDGTVFLRFGDGQYGTAPDSGLGFSARYRVGNGSAGNIGRDALAHAVLPAAYLPPLGDLLAVRNPLPAAGGTDPEDGEHIQRFAPFSYQTQERCVTEADYGQMTTQLTGGAQARGTMRWTGSWYSAFVSIDPSGLTGTAVQDVESGLDKLRMMGTDVVAGAAVIVGLVIELRICVDPEHFKGDVYDALMKVFISGDRCDGSLGLLDASNFTFGQTVYASPLIAAAQSVPGVLSATLVKFTRMDAPWMDGVAQGSLTVAPLDIPRCDNDPDHLDHGTFTLDMDGGK